MRWLLPAFLVLTLTTKAQTVAQLLDGLGQAFSQELDIYDFDDPDFNWNMEGRVQASLNEGINFLKENQPNLALPELEKAVELSPKLWVAHNKEPEKDLRKSKSLGNDEAASLLAQMQ